MTRSLALAAAMVLTCAAALPGAQRAVWLTFKDGRVTLAATGATPSQILAEWARVGGTRIVNGDRVSGPPLVLDLKDVPEMDALGLVLRSAAGFVATARPAGPGAARAPSSLEQVTVLAVRSPFVEPLPMPTDTVPEPPPAAQPPIIDASGARRIIGPDGQPIPDDQEGAPPPPEAPPR